MKRSMAMAVALACCAGTVMAGPTFTRKSGPSARPARPGVADAMPFSDNFDSYVAGSGLGGQGGWVKWEPASVDAQVSSAQASSPSNSMRLVPQTDITQQGNVTSGKWELKCKTYYPSTNVGPGPNDGAFVIGLNQFNAAAPSTQPIGYWSGQVQFHPGTGTVRNYDQQTGPSVPIVPNQWVELRMVIDLATDTWDAFYNGTQFITARPWSTGVSPTGGTVSIACFDFFSGNAVATTPFEFFIDDVSFAQVTTCYANCDGTGGLTANDFACFLTAYTNGASYADCDGIGGLTANDFVCFLTAYNNGCS